MFAFNASGIEYYTLGLLSDWRGFGVFDSDIKLKTSPPPPSLLQGAGSAEMMGMLDQQNHLFLNKKDVVVTA